MRSGLLSKTDAADRSPPHLANPVKHLSLKLTRALTRALSFKKFSGLQRSSLRELLREAFIRYEDQVRGNMNSSPPKRRTAAPSRFFRHSRGYRIGVMLPVLGMLGSTVLAPRAARAESGASILETIGISIAVGTVLGASTLPFYEQPGKHLLNVAYGASAGTVAGIGILLYGWAAGASDSQDEMDSQGATRLGPKDDFLSTRLSRSPANLTARSGGISRLGAPLAPPPLTPTAKFWMPLVSLNL